MKLKWLTLACLLAAVLVAAGCAPAKAPSPAEDSKIPDKYRSIRMVGASIGGKSTTVVMVFATVFNKYFPEISWSSSSGSNTTSTVYITKGELYIGMLGPSHYLQAYGWDKVSESRLRSLTLPTPLSQYVFLIPEDKPWTDITQVPKGLTLSPGRAGSTMPIAAEAALQLAGLSKKDFNWIPLADNELADAWREGKVDLTFTAASGPEPFLMDMYTGKRKFKAMGLSPEQVAKAKAERTFEQIGFTAPAKGNLSEIASEIFKYDVVCPQLPNFLAARDDFPEDIAYRMAKIIDESNAELARYFSPMKYATAQWHMQWAKTPVDIHPGVAKYYKDKGYLK